MKPHEKALREVLQRAQYQLEKIAKKSNWHIEASLFDDIEAALRLPVPASGVSVEAPETLQHNDVWYDRRDTVDARVGLLAVARERTEKSEALEEMWCRLMGRALDVLDTIAAWDIGSDAVEDVERMIAIADESTRLIRSDYPVAPALAAASPQGETTIGGTNFCGHGVVASICPVCQPAATNAGVGECPYVVRKNGCFYRPGAKGYTTDVRDAGQWPQAEAERYTFGVEGVTAHPITDFLATHPAAVSGIPTVEITELDEAYERINKTLSVQDFKGASEAKFNFHKLAFRHWPLILALSRGSQQS